VRRSLGARADGVVGDPLPLALVGWALGCAMVWSSLFAIGQTLYGRYLSAAGLAATALVTGTALGLLSRRLWPDSDPEPAAVAAPGAPPR
jgi:hypothetical protein